MRHLANRPKIVVLLLLFFSQYSYADMMFSGVDIDSASTENINFQVPVGASPVQNTWIRMVTGQGIPPSSFDFTLTLTGGSSATLNTANTSDTIDNNVGITQANLTFEHSPAGHPNVYQIRIDHSPSGSVSPGSPQSWQLQITNNSGNIVVFAVYIGDSQAELDGANVWIRDNGTVDPSGYHTLNNINNLDNMSVPTPSEFWKSPAIRFTSQSGEPTQNPVGGETNNVYVKVRNFGTTPLASVTIEAFWTHFTSGLPPLGDPAWNPLGTKVVNDIDPGSSRETGGFTWNVPNVPGSGTPNHYCIFVRTTASVGPLDPFDDSYTNANDFTRHNTNAAHRNVRIIETVVPPPGTTMPFFANMPVRFFVTNPFKEEKVSKIRIKGLPTYARASRIDLELKSKDKIELKGFRPLVRLRDTDAATADIKAASIRQVKDNSGSRQLAKLKIANPVDLSVAGLSLKPGESRLMEMDIGLSEPLKNGDVFSVDIENVIDGDVVGGVTNVYEFSNPREKPGKIHDNKFYQMLAWILGVVLVIMLIVVVVLLTGRRK